MRNRDADDAALVADAIGGDADAFDTLVRRHQRRAVAVAYRLLGNVDDASDVAQDAFLRAFQRLEQLADPRRFAPWLMRIVGNLALNYRRSRAARAAVGLDDAGDVADPAASRSYPSPGDESEPVKPSEAVELQSAFDRALETLPEKQRTSLVLFSIAGLPQSEVARIMGCTVELVKWNVFQARKTMKDRLSDFLPAGDE